MKFKYKNKPVNVDGWRFRSGKERDHYLWLNSEVQARRVTSFEYEKKYPLEVNGKLVCNIVPDFTVYLPDGRTQIHEIKSPITMTDVWRVKSKLFQILFPHMEYLVNPRKII